MRGIARIVAAAAAVFVINTAAAQAQADRTFVSGHGADTGTCAVTAPCRSFVYAISQTAAAGEIVVLDSAGYGPVTIAQSLIITNPGGVEAGITATSGGDAIQITPSSSANVTLRGLTLNGAGVGANGIDVAPSAPSSVTIIDTLITNFTNDGILVSYNGEGQHNVNIDISGTKAFLNGADGIAILTPNGTSASFVIAGSTANLNFGNGIHVDASTGYPRGAITDTGAMYNKGSGFLFGGSGYFWLAVMRNCYALNNVAPDIYNNAPSGELFLFDNNMAGTLYNEGSTYSDSSNNIIGPSGTLSPAPKE